MVLQRENLGLAKVKPRVVHSEEDVAGWGIFDAIYGKAEEADACTYLTTVYGNKGQVGA